MRHLAAAEHPPCPCGHRLARHTHRLTTRGLTRPLDRTGYAGTITARRAYCLGCGRRFAPRLTVAT